MTSKLYFVGAVYPSQVQDPNEAWGGLRQHAGPGPGVMVEEGSLVKEALRRPLGGEEGGGGKKK